MSRYNGHFSSKFEGCAIVGKMRDEGRKRVVMVYAIPGEPEVVGLYDGVDVWIGSSITFGGDVKARLDDVHVKGLPMEIESGQSRRRFHDGTINGTVYLPPMPGSTTRRKAASAAPVSIPRRMAKTQPTMERRRAR